MRYSSKYVQSASGTTDAEPVRKQRKYAPDIRGFRLLRHGTLGSVFAWITRIPANTGGTNNPVTFKKR